MPPGGEAGMILKMKILIDWQGTSSGGDQLPAGVYYWTLQLNEPRVDVEYIRGEVSILY